MALPKEPRQKMINIMYLVLMALLALEIPDTILNSFVVVNSGLTVTNKNYDEKNQASFGQFRFAMKNDPQKTGPYFKEAQIAQDASNKLCNYIDSVKHVLISEAERVPLKVADTMKLSHVENLGNEDVPTHFLINDAAKEDGSKGEAHKIKMRLNDFRKQMIDIVKKFNPKDTTVLNIGLLTPDEFSKVEGRKVNWEVYNYYATPVAAAITSLSHIQNDVKNTEATIVQYLLSQISAKDYKVSSFDPEIIPNSNYVLAGDSFKAKVFLSAVISTVQPTVCVGDYDSTGKKIGPNIDSTVNVKVRNGIGYYGIKTGAEGPVSLNGVIKVKDPQGNIKSYPFHTDYLVAKPAVVISPTQMNVFYIGVPNPVDISAPGVPADAIRPAFQGPGSISPAPGGKGHYIVRVTSGAGTNCHIGVSAAMPDGSHQNFPPQEFRIKAVPDPTCYVLNKKGNIRVPKVQLSLANTVFAKMDNFDFNLPYTVTSFQMVATVNGISKTFNATGQNFTPDMKRIMSELLPGSTIIIENVHCSSTAGARTIPGVTITIY